MKIVSALLASGILLGGLKASASDSTIAAVAADQPVVILPPFRVDEFSSYLGFSWNAHLDKGKIASVRFSRVEPGSLANKAGLIPGDLLIAIDGHPIVGGEIPDLQRLFARNWKPGDTLEWHFTIERGTFFSRQRTVFLRMRTKPAPEETKSGTAH